MRVSVKYFSVLHTITDKREEIVEMPDGADGEQLLNHIIESYPGVLPYRDFLRLAVNREYCEFKQPLNEMDEVVLIPPVSGG